MWHPTELGGQEETRIHLEYNLRKPWNQDEEDFSESTHSCDPRLGNDKVISKAQWYGAQAWRFEDSAVEEFRTGV